MGIHLSDSSIVERGSAYTIAVLRALPGLGDMLCCIPAMRALRSALPQAQIQLVSLPWSQRVVQRFHSYFDGWLEFPGYPGIPEVPLAPQRVVGGLQQLQSRQFDLVLQMHGSGLHINGFARLMGGRQTAGFYPIWDECPDGDRFFPYPDREPEILRHLRLLEFLGIPSRGSDLEFPLEEGDRWEWEAMATRYNLHRREYICLHPGASVQARRWSYRGFACIADCLAAEGWRIVLTGTAAEAELTGAIAATMHFPAIDLAGKTRLGALAVLLQQARLLICNDTGVSHLAAALAVPSVVIFSHSDPLRWAPLDRQRHRIVCCPLEQTEPGGEMGMADQIVHTALLEARHLLQQVQREVLYAS